jgi:ribose transport system permease protein
VVGTIIFAVIANLLSLLNVSTFLQDAFRGALILVAVGLATVQIARKKSVATRDAEAAKATESDAAGINE